MQQTYSTLLRLSPDQAELFEQLGLAYGHLKHAIYQAVAVGGGKCKDYKNAFLVEHSITARQFNALAIEVQGLIDAVKALLVEEEKKLKQRLKKEKNALKAAKDRISKIDKKQLWLLPKKEAKLRQRLVALAASIEKIKNRLEDIARRLKANVPGICFGSRKLFNAQYHLKQAGFADHAQWQTAWRKARSHQFFFVGSKDETAGNQSCTLSEVEPPPGTTGASGKKVQFSARIRLTDKIAEARAKAAGSLKVKDEHKYEHIAFELGFGASQVQASLKAGRALSYRFHRNNTTVPRRGLPLRSRGHYNGAWSVFISTEVPPAPQVSRAVHYGCVGVDFNADHLAVAEVNRHGNHVKSWSIALDLIDKTSEQREEVISLALKEVVDYAQAQALPIAIEELNFEAKKADMRRKSKRYRRMLSSLAYAQYTQMMRSKCARAGVELFIVNPAFTSVIGRVKYAQPLGLSVHHAAAFVIGRRAMGCRERLPSQTRVVLGPSAPLVVLLAKNRATQKGQGWGAVVTDLRKTLHVVIREQRLSDKRRFNNRQHSPP